MNLGLETAPSVLALCVAELVPTLIVLGLSLWGRSVARKHGTRAWRLASWMPVLGFVVHHVGVISTVVGLVHAFDAVSGAQPQDRAAELSHGIAVAMWATAIGVGTSVALYVASVIAFAVGSFRPGASDHASREAARGSDG